MDTDNLLGALGWTGDIASEGAREAEHSQVAFDSYTTHRALVQYLTLAYRLPEDAKDVAQEAFLRLSEAHNAGQRIDNPQHWLFVVARRLMLDLLRTQKFRASLRADIARHIGLMLRRTIPSPRARVAARERRDQLLEALDVLTDLERECFCARVAGLRLREIGEMLDGKDVRHIGKILDRAVKKIRKALP